MEQNHVQQSQHLQSKQQPANHEAPKERP
jgi:hypothetical protein